ncbi:MAG: amidohydrolase family protein [Rhodospirillaceae bacterium]|jgi:L-fuconolactonase|nr:amidohydrolase family protein [Rhodospirillaceae bacterium]MBT4042331.1 amidohydrolase family protein [Rhodospirillaceae bacterium]MBT4687340.1 amidohydrolase family protein [Rhodospirillaceae bacterium]MBT5081063.1 amidohydrolase family protein [Rhodospirillaceae bacterium]MBT5523665.1 amidohydrolase family protein [Rhodospirillaceae bacterium]
MASNMGQIAPDDDWLAGVDEAILEPDLAIIDPHHHLWLRNGYTYLMPELSVDLASGHNVVATVFAECHSMYRQAGPEAERSMGETEFVRGQAAMSAGGQFGPTRACDVMFGNVDMTLGQAVEPLLEKHIDASGGRFTGVRYSTGWDANEGIHNVAPAAGMLIDDRVGEAAAVLSRMNLSLDSWLYHPQLDEVATLADAHPNLTIILNHVGSPILGGPYRGKSDEVFADWRTRIKSVGERPNVFVKLGAMPIRMPGFDGDRSLPPRSEEVAAAWRPWIETCIEAFGPSRSMFESNFPVQKRWCSYQVCWNAFKRLAAGASDTEKQDLFAGAAARAYRMDERANSLG